jgi:mRNA interferase MazF
MSIYKQRDIVLITFPFSDLTGQKVRPVIILSNSTYNQQSQDILVCGITANLKVTPFSIIVDITDVEHPGTLKNKSKIRVDTIASLEQSLVIKKIARLNTSIFKQIVEMINNLIK